MKFRLCLLAFLTACRVPTPGTIDQGINDAAAELDAAAHVPSDLPPPVAPLDGGLLDPCNGNPLFCDRPYNALSYPTTHSSAASGALIFACPTQEETVRTQLDQGIRALELFAHTAAAGDDAAAQLELCADGDCARGHLAIGLAFAQVRAFLDANPREVVTLVVKGGVGAADLAAALTATGLDAFAWPHVPSDPWPTLRAMIQAGTRLVVLADVSGSAPRWMLPLWTYVAETGTAFASKTSMTCDVTRGPSNAPLYLLNQYLVDVDGDLGTTCAAPTLAHQANAEPFLLERAQACTTLLGHKPTFLSVDFYADGDVLGAARTLSTSP
jgi:hypothetical protein